MEACTQTRPFMEAYIQTRPFMEAYTQTRLLEGSSYVSGNGELAFQTDTNTEHTDQRHTDCWELEKVRFLGLTKVRPRAGGGCFQL